MKTLLYIVLFIPLMWSCTDKQNETTESHAHADQKTTSFVVTPEQSELANIKTGKLTKEVLRSGISCTGMIGVPPQNKATVTAKMGGTVEKVNFYPGDLVQKGVTLCTLSNAKYIDLQRDYLNNKIQLELKAADHIRKQKLFEKEAISEKQYQQIKADWQSEKVQVEALKAKLEWIGFNVASIEANGIKQRLAVTSPISGYITEIPINAGTQLQGGEVLYEIINKEHLHVELNVYQKDLPFLEKGQPLAFTIPEVDHAFEGEVYLIGQKVDEQNRTINIHGHFHADHPGLRPGTVVHATIFTEVDSIWGLPTTGIKKIDGQPHIFEKTNDGFVPIEVETGKQSEGFTEILNPSALMNKELITEGAYYMVFEEPEHSH